jgi:hypothetical protein
MTQSQSYQPSRRIDDDGVSDGQFEPIDDHEAIDDTPEDPAIARERTEERERAEARNAAHERSDRASHDGDVHAHGSFGTSYLGGHSTEDSWQQWRKIQADFVDNPRDAVSDAHGLVGELIDNIVRQFNEERNQMEQRWSSGQDVSTEELRTCLQTYRDFFGRLLSKVDAKN